jgi:hypothetical protein
MSFMGTISRLYPDNEYLRTSARVKAIVFFFFAVAFLIYIPIGIWVTCPARLLSIGECIEVRLVVHVLRKSVCT